MGPRAILSASGTARYLEMPRPEGFCDAAHRGRAPVSSRVAARSVDHARVVSSYQLIMNQLVRMIYSMLHDTTRLIGANSVQLTPKQEDFCLAYVECGDATRSYRQAFDCSPSIARGTVQKRAYDLMHTPKVRERIRALQAAAAADTVVTVRQQLVDLAEMTAVDVSDLWWLEYRPCAACNRLYDADLAEHRPLPDMTQGLPPHPSCADVRAHQCVQMLPIDQWPAAARRLYDGVEMQRDGTMRPVFRDRSQLQDMLNKILGAYVSRSENITAHVSVNRNTITPTQAATLAPRALVELLWKPSS
jgi:Terminase small subunit